jgi:molybdate transport system regulatory protein
VSAKRPPAPPGLRIRLVLAPGFMIGPGKADLLQGIDETGSIAAAGRGMRMSYKRAWLLVETLNAGFRAPLVTATRGGKSRGGAALTDLGREVLAAYRGLEAKATAAAAAEIAIIRAAMLDDRNAVTDRNGRSRP